MPELPEVETVASELTQVLKNKKVKAVKVHEPKTVNFLVRDFEKKLKNKIIKKVWRRAKLLVIEFEEGLYIAAHLKMTGQFLYQSNNNKLTGGGHPEDFYLQKIPSKFTRVEFALTDGSHLYFNDIRKFGWLKLFSKKDLEEFLKNMQYGPEPLEKDFTAEYLFEKIKNRNVPIKPLLMDQKLIAGIGNIYAAEVLFKAGIDPQKKANVLTKIEVKKIYQAIVSILKLAVKYKGTTADNFADIFGQAGNYIKKLKVYGRKDQSCLVCGSKLKEIKQAQRTTVFCPKCQR